MSKYYQAKTGATAFQNFLKWSKKFGQNTTWVSLYHYTSKERAKKIQQQGFLKNSINGIYFVTRPSSYGSEWGDNMVECKVKISDIENAVNNKDVTFIFDDGILGFEGLKKLPITTTGIKTVKQKPNLK